MTNEELRQFFSTHDWWDNSKIKTIRGCRRKAFYQLIGPRGVKLNAQVGDGANFGSSFHAGLARYYNTWGKSPESSRRVFAARAFADEWGQHFPGDHTQSKHRLDHGLDILNSYFDRYLAEDELFEPVESELGFAIEINPAEGGPAVRWQSASWQSASAFQPTSQPFYYVGRIDGIFRRIADDTYWMRETKTAGTAAEKRLQQLKFDHQPVGYVACLRALQPKFHITGFLGDVVLVAAQKLEFCRDYFHVKQAQCDSWRTQTIATVEDWRRRVAGWDVSNKDQAALDTYFEQDTERCHDYGRCSFYDLCDYGVNNDTLANFDENVWNPLLQRTPDTIVIKGD